MRVFQLNLSINRLIEGRILFDIEVVFLLPWTVSLSQLNLLGFWSVIDFLLELGVGYIYVLKMYALDW